MPSRASQATIDKIKATKRSNILTGFSDPGFDKRVNEGINKGFIDPADLRISELPPGDLAIEGAKQFALGVTEGAEALGKIPAFAGNAMSLAATGEPLPEAEAEADIAGNIAQTIGDFGREAFPTTPTEQFDSVTGAALSGLNFAGSIVPEVTALPLFASIGIANLTPGKIRALSQFQKLLLGAARKPGKFAAIEETLGFFAGAGGELTARLAGEDMRIVGQLGAVFGAPFLNRIGEGVVAAKRMIAPGGQKQAEEILIDSFRDAFEVNPQQEKNLNEFLRIQEQTGVLNPITGQRTGGIKGTLGQATGNPALIAAERSVGIDEEALKGANRKILTTYQNRIRDKYKVSPLRLREGAPEIEFNVRGPFQEELAKERDALLQNIQAQMDDALFGFKQKLTGSIEGFDSVNAGKQIQDTIIELETVARGAISELYKQLPNFKVDPSDLVSLNSSIFRALKKDAKGVPLPVVADIAGQIRNSFAFKSKKAVSEVGLFDPVLGRAVVTKKIVPLDVSGNTLGALNQIDGVITAALRKSGAEKPSSDTIRRLVILKKGIEGTFSRLASSTKVDPSFLPTLREGKRLRTEAGNIFQDFDVKTLLAKTSQTQLRTSPEDVIRTLTTGKNVVRNAETYKQMFGNTPESKELMKKHVLDLMEGSASTTAVSTGELVLNPKAVRKFLINKKNRQLIKAYGLTDEFADVKKATETFESTFRAFKRSEEDLTKSAFAHFADTDNPGQFIEGLIRNPEKLKEFQSRLKRLGSERLQEGFKRVVSEDLFNSTLQSTIARFDPGTPQFQNNILDKMLIENRTQLELAVGKNQINDLLELSESIRLADFDALTGGNLDALLKDIQGVTLKKATNTVRQVKQRILSPATVAITLPLDQLQAIKSQLMRDTFFDLTQDPKRIKEMIQLARTKDGIGVVRSLFTPGLGILFNLTENQVAALYKQRQMIANTPQATIFHEESLINRGEGATLDPEQQRKTFDSIRGFADAIK